MIAKLKGLVDSLGEDWVIIDVGGVGYLVYASRRTLSQLPATGDPVTLMIETHVREDHIHLFGFTTERERAWFRLLQTVQGVGARVALGILSVLDADALSQAIAVQDKTAVSRANGVGPKLAQRIVNELKDKAAGLAVPAGKPGGAPAPAMAGNDAAVADAVSALTNLGYKPAEAFAAVSRARQALDGTADVGALIRAGLKELGKELAH
ncbi:MAG: Holliday junction branch migration protein RuvA [Alphaproteobacteria bacterium]|nr:MAG: Holliday junction branch migration protein RuvA [Alphaproteobacteria bacterium]